MYFISIFVISQPIDENAKFMAQLSLFVSLVNFPKSLLWRVIPCMLNSRNICHLSNETTDLKRLHKLRLQRCAEIMQDRNSARVNCNKRYDLKSSDST